MMALTQHCDGRAYGPSQPAVATHFGSQSPQVEGLGRFWSQPR